MTNTIQRFILFLSVLSVSVLQASADPLVDLEQRLIGQSQLAGSFIQRQYISGGGEPVLSSGRFKLLQPGYFAWEIQSPDSQLVIAGPQFIWHYDRDLETVTRRPVSGQPSLSPLQVLGGRQGALAANYTVSYGEQKGEFILLPVTEDAGFDRLVLVFAGQQILRLTFTDSLGQRVDVELNDLDYSTPLSAADFHFSPPEGADLFYHDQ